MLVFYVGGIKDGQFEVIKSSKSKTHRLMCMSERVETSDLTTIDKIRNLLSKMPFHQQKFRFSNKTKMANTYFFFDTVSLPLPVEFQEIGFNVPEMGLGSVPFLEINIYLLKTNLYQILLERGKVLEHIKRNFDRAILTKLKKR